MAISLAHAGSPQVEASFAPDLGPAVMTTSGDWSRARAYDLRGCDGSRAQRASVRVLWNNEWIFFAFACVDAAIVSPGTSDGVDHFRLGDTAEVFLAPHAAKAYAEVHATPAGQKSIYYCRDYRQAAEPPAASALIDVRAAADAQGWRAFIAVPRSLFDRDSADGYDVFFARYDYASAGSKPVLSSFPAQTGKPDFHRRSDYARLRLLP